jgi:hypothetical protein
MASVDNDALVFFISRFSLSDTQEWKKHLILPVVSVAAWIWFDLVHFERLTEVRKSCANQFENAVVEGQNFHP